MNNKNDNGAKSFLEGVRFVLIILKLSVSMGCPGLSLLICLH